MKVGFTLVIQEQTAQLTIREPEQAAVGPALISIYRSGDDIAAVMGTLHYKSERLAELAGRLQPAAFEDARSNDAALAYHVYSQGGESALDKLEGDFCVAILDAGRRVLIGMRDPMGGYPLFWVRHEQTVALGTMMRPLCAVLGRREVNSEYLANYIATGGERREMEGEACVYNGINRVLPAMRVRFSTGDESGNGSDQRQVYWNWADHIADPGAPEDWTAAYMARLREAVSQQMVGVTASHLSGGIDSTAVSLLARDAVTARGPGARIQALSLVYERLPKLSQEREYVDAVARDDSAMVCHRLNGDDVLGYNAARRPLAHDEPIPGLSTFQFEQFMVSAAASRGAQSILTGIGADELFATKPYYLADLLRRGRLVKAWREASRWSRAHNSSRWVMFGTFGLSAAGSLPASLASLLRINEFKRPSFPGWMRPEFIKRFNLASRMRERSRQALRAHPSAALSMMLTGLGSYPGDASRWYIAAPLGVRLSHPFLDPRVLSTGLGIAARLKPQPSRQKPFLADAFRNVLPAKIIDRRAKGHFDEVYYMGLKQNLGVLEQMIRRSRLADQELFDRKAICDDLQRACLGGTGAKGTQHLDLALSLLYWAEQAELT